MDPTKLPKAFQEALGAFEGFRRLGFASDHLYLVVNGPIKTGAPPKDVGKCQLQMVLKDQGREFAVGCGLVRDTPASIQRTWTQVAEALNKQTVDSTGLDRVWRRSHVCLFSDSFRIAIIGKGFRLPLTLTQN